MKIELRALMDHNEMISHIFLDCLSREQLAKIRDKYVKSGKDAINWKEISVQIPVEMKIGGISVNPKSFFDKWRDQMQRLIADEAKELLSEKLGSKKIENIQNKLSDFQEILKSWENEISWDVENPFKEQYVRMGRSIVNAQFINRKEET